MTNEAGRERSKMLKALVLGKYGGAVCACCGETGMTFLTLDHVNNNGSSHRKRIGGGGALLYGWLRKKGYPPGYQVLCYNCNIGKYKNGGVCPHKDKKVS
jgi:hypothetical protein